MEDTERSVWEQYGPVERVKHVLDTAGYEGDIRHISGTIHTVDDASMSVGVPPEHILKSILVSVDKTYLALVLLSGHSRADLKKVKIELMAKKVSMAYPDAVFEQTGFRPGGVPPLGYLNQPVTLLDEKLFIYPVVWAAAGDDQSFFPVAPSMLMAYTGGRKADVGKD